MKKLGLHLSTLMMVAFMAITMIGCGGGGGGGGNTGDGGGGNPNPTITTPIANGIWMGDIEINGEDVGEVELFANDGNVVGWIHFVKYQEYTLFHATYTTIGTRLTGTVHGYDAVDGGAGYLLAKPDKYGANSFSGVVQEQQSLRLTINDVNGDRVIFNLQFADIYLLQTSLASVSGTYLLLDDVNRQLTINTDGSLYGDMPFDGYATGRVQILNEPLNMGGIDLHVTQSNYFGDYTGLTAWAYLTINGNKYPVMRSIVFNKGTMFLTDMIRRTAQKSVVLDNTTPLDFANTLIMPLGE